MDENEFFRQGTNQICSSLKIETAMMRCLMFLKDFMPAGGLILSKFDPSLNSFLVISHVSLDKNKKSAKMIPCSKEAVRLLEHPHDDYHVKVFNDPENDLKNKIISDFLGEPNIPRIVMHLTIEEEKVGSLILYSDSRTQYTDKDSRLFLLLNDPLVIALSNALKYQELLNYKEMLAKENVYLIKELTESLRTEVIGEESGLKKVMEKVLQVALSKTPVLLLGETGVGKEVIANAIQSYSLSKDRPFIKVNCGAIPEHLVDSELFGHEKGAFTGAISRKPGRFERAQGGTILLDEIGDLPLSSQTRLLRVLQNKEIERVGGTKTLPIDVRIIASTSLNLEEMVNVQKFRKDLYFRLNVFPIVIPPLRERKEDIPALVSHFIERKSIELKLSNFPKIADGTIEQFKLYNWPGNVRELENMIERALIQSRWSNDNAPLVFEPLLQIMRENGRDKTLSPIDVPPELDAGIAKLILNTLEYSKGKINGTSGAAEILGIKPSTLRSKMKKLGIPYGIAR